MVCVLFAVSIAVFVIFFVIPGGDPALRLAGRNGRRGEHRPDPQEVGLRPALPGAVRRLIDHLFIKRDMISYQDQTEVLPTIERGIPRTLSLAVGAAISGRSSASGWA